MPKSHSLFRLYSKIHNVPHLITPEAFTVILDYLDSRNQAGIIKADIYEEDYESLEEDQPKMYKDGLGVLRVDGSLTYKPVMTMCGSVGTSYTQLVEQVEEMAEAGVRTIVMEVTSGGGEASHVFQACEDIRAICDEHNIKMIGYADTVAASAAYALICVCDEVIANPSASLGSIGCVVALLDASEAMKKEGYRRIFVTSGENKVPFNEDGFSFKKEFLEEIQEDVDKLNVEFSEHVSRYTGLSADTIMGFEAKCFNADEALERGLCNKIMTNREFAAYVADLHKRSI
jgi:ClpP class serine protease